MEQLVVSFDFFPFSERERLIYSNIGRPYKMLTHSASTKEMLVGTFLIQFVRRAFLVCFLRLYE